MNYQRMERLSSKIEPGSTTQESLAISQKDLMFDGSLFAGFSLGYISFQRGSGAVER